VEAVKGDTRFWEVFFHSGNERRRHITTDLVNGLGVALVCCQVLREGSYGFLILARGAEEQALLVHVKEQADVVVALAAGGLINTDAGYLREIEIALGLVYVVVDDPPEAGVVFTNQPGHSSNRHLSRQRHDEGFKQECKPCARSRPGHLDPLDTADLGTRHARNAGAQVSRILKEVQMAPLRLLRVVGFGALYTAVGAGKGAAAREIDGDVQTTLLG